jgi:hypothetical protein
MELSSCYRPLACLRAKAGCLLEKPLKINWQDANSDAVMLEGDYSATKSQARDACP